MIGLCGGEYNNLSQRTIKMTNSNLIPVFNGQIANQSVQLCNARSLHEFLEVKNRFNDWISDRISDYGFQQDEDYIIVTERTLGRPRKEYHITLNMGKELAMVERNKKGRMVRKYFIECERRALQQPKQLALPEPEKTFTLNWTESELKRLASFWCTAFEMHQMLKHIEPGLHAIGSSFASTVYTQVSEYQSTLDLIHARLQVDIDPLQYTEPENRHWQYCLNTINRYKPKSQLHKYNF
ncbi:antA/AntB antirepressor family protein [Gallibacterium genomosp. 3]|uniref:antA/AntB antirepressor family protein n=1 Tax=Gallibacterium genomosp. 3 TaxID=505345 RepID=UPI001FD87252|nr:antA/AntB antirepressor family protein [Gallibacterium genomosp. 3]